MSWRRRRPPCGMALHAAAGDAAPAPAAADLLRSVLRNLVENAVRYGRDGGAVCVEAGAAGGSLFLSVCDDGPGIPAEQRASGAARFHRLGQERSGAGLTSPSSSASPRSAAPRSASTTPQRAAACACACAGTRPQRNALTAARAARQVRSSARAILRKLDPFRRSTWITARSSALRC